MAKTIKEEIQEETKVLQEGQSVDITIDEKGRYVFPVFQMHGDDEVKTVNLVVQKMLNMGVFNSAYFKWLGDNDYRVFGATIFKNMVVYPSEARTINFWDYDPEALVYIVNAMVEIMGKKKTELKRNLSFNL